MCTVSIPHNLFQQFIVLSSIGNPEHKQHVSVDMNNIPTAMMLLLPILHNVLYDIVIFYSIFSPSLSFSSLSGVDCYRHRNIAGVW